MLRIRPGVEAVEVSNGMFLLDLGTGVYWHINESATTILRELCAGHSLDQIATATAAATSVDPGIVRLDCTTLLAELRRRKLVEGEIR